MKSTELNVLYYSSVTTHFRFFLIFSFVFLLKIVIRKLFFHLFIFFFYVMLPVLYMSNISPALLPVTRVFLFPIEQR